MQPCDDESTTSSELLRAHLPTSKVVKAFNNIMFGTLATLPRLAGAADPSVGAPARTEWNVLHAATACLVQDVPLCAVPRGRRGS